MTRSLGFLTFVFVGAFGGPPGVATKPDQAASSCVNETAGTCIEPITAVLSADSCVGTVVSHACSRKSLLGICVRYSKALEDVAMVRTYYYAEPHRSVGEARKLCEDTLGGALGKGVFERNHAGRLTR
jgi:hypothetical protein